LSARWARHHWSAGQVPQVLGLAERRPGVKALDPAPGGCNCSPSGAVRLGARSGTFLSCPRLASFPAARSGPRRGGFVGFGPSLVHCRRVVPQPLLMPLISAAGLAEFLPLLLRRRLLQQPVPPRNFLLGRRRRRLHGFTRARSPRRFPVPGRMRAAQNVSEKEEQLQPEFSCKQRKTHGLR
jgi:hypothetical protein